MGHGVEGGLWAVLLYGGGGYRSGVFFFAQTEDWGGKIAFANLGEFRGTSK